MTFVNTDQAVFWSSMARTWVEMDHRLEHTAGEPGRMAMDRLDPRPGERILDLGCGTGPTSVELASRVGPGGSVVGVDIAEEMLVRARQRASEQGSDNVSFLHADVQAGSLGSREYDAAFSRFGVMFYSDPAAAFSKVREALRPGGRLSFVCWQGATANEWMLVPGAAVMSVTGTPPPTPTPGQPGPFSLCDPGLVHSILATAGFTQTEVEPHNDVVTFGAEHIDEQAASALRMGAAREALKDADEATIRLAHGAVVDALRSKVQDGEVRLARGVLLVGAGA